MFRVAEKQFLDTSSEFSGSEFASVAWEVSVDKNTWNKKAKEAGKNAFNLNCTLRLTDCFKIINIEFGATKLEEIDERIAKLDELQKSLKRLRGNLTKAKKVAGDWLKKPREETIVDDDD